VSHYPGSVTKRDQPLAGGLTLRQPSKVWLFLGLAALILLLTSVIRAQQKGDGCVKCHEDEVKAFAADPHATGKTTCESCHGNGAEHVAGGGDRTKIFSLNDAGSKEVSAKCLECHEKERAKFEQTAHSKGRMSCTSCHTVHGAGGSKRELKTTEPELCNKCHKDVPQQFAAPVHHPVNDGKVSCSSCHNPHGEVAAKGMKKTERFSAECKSCHKEQAGPFKYPHAAVNVEGCMGCHAPHGGDTAKLMNRAKVDTICTYCHAPALLVKGKTVNGHQPGGAAGTCISCHVDVHGSNSSEVFFDGSK